MERKNNEPRNALLIALFLLKIVKNKIRVIKNSKKSLIILNNIKFSFDKKDRKLYKYKNKGPLDSHWF